MEINAYINKNISNKQPHFTPQGTVRKEKETKAKARRNEIIKIRAKRTEIENNKTRETVIKQELVL